MNIQQADHAFPVWVINGRDATSWRKGKTTGLRGRPWLVASFQTKAEKDACMLGIAAAIGGALTNVVYLSDEDARRVDAEVMAQISATKPNP